MRCWKRGGERDVLLSIDGRVLAAIEVGVAHPPLPSASPASPLPGVANVHSHAFQRAMAGLVERRGPEDDSFWTWREVMYRFLAAMTPDDIEAVAAWAYVEMLEAGFTSVGEFHYLHNAPDGTRYADPAETGGRIVAAAEASGIGLALLPSFYAHGGCGGKPPTPRSGALPVRSRWLLASCSRQVAGTCSAWTAPRSASRRIRLRAVDAAELARARRAMDHRAHPHPRRRAAARGGGVRRLVRRPARCNGCSTT